MKYLITGGTGFVGRHLIPFLLDSGNKVVSVERLSEHNTEEHDGLSVLLHDFRAEFPQWAIDKLQDVDIIIHNGGAVQAIKSLEDPQLYIESNIVGTYNMLELAKKIKPKVFLYTSSAEAFGACPEGYSFTEKDRLNPSTPYSASKAGAESLVNVYHKSFGVPTIILRTMNLFGIMRNPDTYIPIAIKNILKDNPVTIHVDSHGNPGIRQWLDIDSYLDCIQFILDKGKIGDTYHVAGEEVDNLFIADMIASVFSKTDYKSKLVDITATHPAHDMRFSIDDSKIKKLGWENTNDFYIAFKNMVEWTVEHKDKWL